MRRRQVFIDLSTFIPADSVHFLTGVDTLLEGGVKIESAKTKDES